jgi:hypothetical protein
MKFDIVLNQVIILFIIMITGIAAAKAGVISDGTSKKTFRTSYICYKSHDGTGFFFL